MREWDLEIIARGLSAGKGKYIVSGTIMHVVDSTNACAVRKSVARLCV